MKEINVDEIVIKITEQMLKYIDQEQIRKLQDIIWMSMNGLKIFKEECELSTDVDDNDYLLKMFLAAKKIEGCTDNTIKCYITEYKFFLKTVDKNLRDISTNDVRMYLAYLKMQRHNSDITVNNKIRILYTLFNWLVEEEYIVRSPMNKIKQSKTEKKVKEVYSSEQQEVIKCNCSRERDIAIVELLSSSGIRISELTGMNREDVDLNVCTAKVMGKGRKERNVMFSGAVAYHMKRYLAEREDDNPALFVQAKKPYGRLSNAAIRSMLKKNADTHDVVKNFRAHPHKFRRTMATNMLDRGANVGSVQALLGHSSSKTTLDCYYVPTVAAINGDYRRYAN